MHTKPSKYLHKPLNSFYKLLNTNSRSFWGTYRLPNSFVDIYRSKKVNFGFNGLGEIAYLRTYSRTKEDGSNEQWADTVERIVNGWFTMQKQFVSNKLDPSMVDSQAMRMFDKIFHFKFLPPGRGIWAMGSKITEQK